MPVKIKSTRRLVNPTGGPKAKPKPKPKTKPKAKCKPKPKAKPKAKPKRKNPGVLTLGFLNGKGASMTHKKKPGPKKKPHHNNPSKPRASRAIARSGDLLKTGAFALAGLVLTRQIPQAVLGSRNNSFVGYLANIFVAIASAAAVGKYGGKAAGTAVGVGGGLYVVERILNEQFTPLGKALSLSGVGDASAHGGLAGIRQAYFPMPVVHDRTTGQPIIPREITEAAIAAMPAPTASGVGRFAGRY